MKKKKGSRLIGKVLGRKKKSHSNVRIERLGTLQCSVIVAKSNQIIKYKILFLLRSKERGLTES